jgi:uncharacterized membrane protein
MKLILGILTTMVTLAYPFIIFYGSEKVEPKWLMLGFAGLFMIRSLTLHQGVGKLIGMPIYIFIVMLCLGAFILGKMNLMYYIPSLISLGLLGLFVHSLFNPPTFIEKFARRENPNLPPAAVVYCKIVTYVWCLFFIFNASYAAYLANQGDVSQWTKYTGFYSYLLIAALFSIEFGIRIFIKPRLDRSAIGEDVS